MVNRKGRHSEIFTKGRCMGILSVDSEKTFPIVYPCLIDTDTVRLKPFKSILNFSIRLAIPH